MKKIFILLGACMFFLCSCSFSGKQREAEQQEMLTQTVPESTMTTNIEQEMAELGTVDIQQSDVIVIEKDREVMMAQGDINEVFYFLPGYKDVPVAKENIKKELEHVLICLEKAQRRKSDEPLPWLDGAGVKINYVYEGEDVSLEMYSTYEDNCVMVNINGGGMQYSEMYVSEDLFHFIHELSKWEEFDINQLNMVTTMTAQVVQGYQASKRVASFSEEETKKIMEQFIHSAEVTDEGSCGYNIQINLFQDGVLLYQGYLAGDSCAEIGLESQYFMIDSDIINEVYKKLDYEMTVAK